MNRMIRKNLCILNVLFKPIKGNESFFLIFPVLLLPHTFSGFVRDVLNTGISKIVIADTGSIFTAFLYSYISCTLISVTKSKVLKILLYTISISVFLVNIYLRVSFGTLLSANILMLIGETSTQEIKDFIEVFLLSKSLLITVLVILTTIYIIIYVERHQKRLAQLIYKKEIVILIIVILIIVWGSSHLLKYLLPVRSESSNELADYFRTTDVGRPDYLTNLFHSSLYLNVASKELVKAEKINNTVGNINIVKEISYPFYIILVIGESSSKWHSNLYGYTLNTQPILTHELKSGNLIVFEDVISNYCHTSESLRSTMSCGEIYRGKQWYETPYFPTIFAKAGYNVYFWDNQFNPASAANWDFTLNSYLHNQCISKITYKECNSQIYKYDGDLIEDFKTNVFYKLDTLSMIMFHLNGQHFNVDNRYPNNEVKIFNELDIRRNDKYLTNEMKRHIASYDNSMYYTDSIIGRIIGMFRDKNALLLYFSDHGEINYDYSDQMGRKVPVKHYTQQDVKYLYGIPFYVWCSNKFKEYNKDVFAALCKNRKRPFALDNLSQLLLSLGGVYSEVVDSSRNVLSDSYRERPRILEGYIYYEDYY